MGDGGGRPADGDETTTDDSVLHCAACGETIDPAEWHPVRTWIDRDDEFHVDAFCSMACRSERTRATDDRPSEDQGQS